MKQWILLSFSIFQLLSACAQSSAVNKRVTGNIGGPCEGCEAIYECTRPFATLEQKAWLPDWNDRGTRLTVSGIVYQADGKTPAADVILYVYHTDQTGIYPKKGDEQGWGKRHGYIRAWLKTNEKGEYQFFTLKPASYPNTAAPAHIHITVKEPGKNEYYIDEYLFDDDPFLTAEERKLQPGRGGSGILKTTHAEGGVLTAQRNIILGKNIPQYR